MEPCCLATYSDSTRLAGLLEVVLEQDQEDQVTISVGKEVVQTNVVLLDALQLPIV